MDGSPKLQLFLNYFTSIVMFIVGQYELVAEKMMCGGGHESKDCVGTVQACAIQCTNVASMFIYGREECQCFCETAASADGTCNQESNGAQNLYKIIKSGKIL